MIVREQGFLLLLANRNTKVAADRCPLRVDAVEKVGLPGGVMLFGSFDPAETSRLGFAAA